MTKVMSKAVILFAVIVLFVAPVRAEETEETQEVYTGVYKDKQIIPNLMATLCKMNAEDAVKDNNKLYKCINQLVIKATHKNAATRDEGVKELEAIRVEELKIMMALAISKGASIADYEDPEHGIIKRLSDANDNEQTEHDDNAAVVNTNATLMALINSMRDLYAEDLKYVAVSNISTISKDVIEDYLTEEEKQKIEEEDEKKKTEAEIEGSDANSMNVNVKYTTESPYITDWKYVENNQCERKVCVGEGDDYSKYTCQKETAVCPDGTYYDPKDANIGIICAHEVCELVADKNVDGEIIKTAFAGANLCSVTRNGPAGQTVNTEVCPDGEHQTADGRKVLCSAGSCTAPYGEEDESDTPDGGKVVKYLGDGQCEIEYSDGDGYTEEGPCPDGKFKVSEGVYMECVNGSCAGTLAEEVEVVANNNQQSLAMQLLNSAGLNEFMNEDGSINMSEVLSAAGLDDFVNEDGSVSVSSVLSGAGVDNFINEDGSVNINSILSEAGITVSSDGTIDLDDLMQVAGASDGKTVDLNKLLSSAGVSTELPDGISSVDADELKSMGGYDGKIDVNKLLDFTIVKGNGSEENTGN